VFGNAPGHPDTAGRTFEVAARLRWSAKRINVCTFNVTLREGDSETFLAKASLSKRASWATRGETKALKMYYQSSNNLINDGELTTVATGLVLSSGLFSQRNQGAFSEGHR
jgi:hypothetical protein